MPPLQGGWGGGLTKLHKVKNKKEGKIKFTISITNLISDRHDKHSIRYFLETSNLF